MTEDVYGLRVSPAASPGDSTATYERLQERSGVENHRFAFGLRSPARRAAKLQATDAVLHDAARRDVYHQAQQARDGVGLDYRPLPPARRCERSGPVVPLVPPEHFGAKPTRHWDRSVVSSLIIGGGFVVLLLVLLQSGVRTGSSAAVLATPGIPNLELPYSTEQLRAARAQAEHSQDATVWVGLGNALFDNLEQMREHARLSPQYQSSLPQWLEVTQSYSRALELGAGPDTRADLALALLYAGNVANDKGAITRALTEVQRALQAQPDNPRALLNDGLILAGLIPPRPDQAVAAWRQLLRVAPRSQEAGQARSLLAAYGQ